MIQAGGNVIEIRGISSNIDVESPRVHGLGRDARVFDVSCNTSTAHEPLWCDRKQAEDLKELRAERVRVHAERKAREREAALLDDAAAATVREKGVDVALMDQLLERKRDTTKAVMELKDQLKDLERKIRVLESGFVGKCETTIVATVIGKREHQVSFQLTYCKCAVCNCIDAHHSLLAGFAVVRGVSWRPSYDLHATTLDGHTSPDVSLVYCANITQTTGEDWNNVALTLSNASSQTLKSLSVPTLSPLTLMPTATNTSRGRVDYQSGVTIVPPPPFPPSFPPLPMTAMMPTMRASVRSRSSSPDWSSRSRSPRGIRAEARPAAAIAPPQVDAAAADRSPLALAYRVEGAVTLPSDGLAHRIAIAVLDFQAEIKYVCAPRMNTAVFIEASVKNTSEYELLAGPVSVFMDGGFVTKTSLGVSSISVISLRGPCSLTDMSCS